MTLSVVAEDGDGSGSGGSGSGGGEGGRAVVRHP